MVNTDAQKIGTLRAQRGVVKRGLTRIERFVIEEVEPATVFDIGTRLEALEDLKSQFNDIQSQLEAIDPTETTEEAEERACFEDRLFSVKAKLLEYKHVKAINPNESFGNTVIEVGTDLPEMKVPEFAGNYFEWPSFIDVFDSMVHNNTMRGMTNIRRFSILRNACKGAASEAIMHLPLTGDNYEVARKMLIDRYQNKRLIFESFVKKLFDLPEANCTASLRALSDSINAQMSALELIANPEEIAYGILMHLIMSKLDSSSLSKWEEHSASQKEIPNWQEFKSFLDKRCTVLEGIEFASPKSAMKASYSQEKPARKAYLARSSTENCAFCKGSCEHISCCSAFLKLSPRDRSNAVRELPICIQCLESHDDECTQRCSTCGFNHHSLLHFAKRKVNEKSQQDTQELKPNTSKQGESQTNYLTVVKYHPYRNPVDDMMPSVHDNYVFIATAVVLVKANNGKLVPLRVALDGASQTNLITAKAAEVLGLKTHPVHVNISGIHGSSRTLNNAVKIEFKSSVNDFTGEFFAVIDPYFEEKHPTTTINVSDWSVPNSIRLADPLFNVPKEIDILINAQLTYSWQAIGKIVESVNRPILQETALGWVVVGNYQIDQNHCTQYSDPNLTISATLKPLNQFLEKVLAIEELPTVENWSVDENMCEDHYNQHVSCQTDGRLVVKIPFKIEPSFGTSYGTALKKFRHQPDIVNQYKAFMIEYTQLNHCHEMSDNAGTISGYYISNFDVTNPNRIITKLKIVLYASKPTSSGLSLNDIVLVAPTTQRDGFAHLLFFRCKLAALCGDISKLYRQILVHPDGQEWQRVLWYNELVKLCRFQLNIIIYGTASAQFLATRVLKPLVVEEPEMLVGAKGSREDFDVHNRLISVASIQEVIQEVKSVLTKSQLPIRTFNSSSMVVLKAIPVDDRDIMLQVSETDVIKILGVSWHPTNDVGMLVYAKLRFLRPVTVMSMWFKGPEFLYRPQLVNLVDDILKPSNPEVLFTSHARDTIRDCKLHWWTTLKKVLESVNGLVINLKNTHRLKKLLFPGTNNVVLVVNGKTSTGICRQRITHLCSSASAQ